MTIIGPEYVASSTILMAEVNSVARRHLGSHFEKHKTAFEEGSEPDIASDYHNTLERGNSQKSSELEEKKSEEQV